MRVQHREATDWVNGLSSTAAATPQAAGWTPPTLNSVIAPEVDLEAERKMAQEKGFRAGYAEGMSAGAERGIAEGRRVGREEILAAQSAAVEVFRAALEEVVAGVGPAVERWRESLESRTAELAIDAVRALLAAELATERPSALGIVREALGHTDGALHATIRLSPFDRAELAEHREEILAACTSLRDVELVDDRSIQGGCIVETENGVVDATLATRLSILEAA